jgi:YD repeat-containing protein
MTDALSQTTSYTFDRGNRMVAVINPRGATYSRTIDHDALDRTRQFSSPSLSAPIVMTHNGVDWRTDLTDATGTTSFGHDALGRITSVQAPGTGTIGYTYNARGERVGVSYPSGASVGYTYTLDGQLETITGAVGISYGYDAAGRLASVTRGNSAIVATARRAVATMAPTGSSICTPPSAGSPAPASRTR